MSECRLLGRVGAQSGEGGCAERRRSCRAVGASGIYSLFPGVCQRRVLGPSSPWDREGTL